MVTEIGADRNCFIACPEEVVKSGNCVCINRINNKVKMPSEKQKLKKCFDDVVWMAIRYAHGRHSYAPGMVRDAIKSFQEVFPDWKPKQDPTIEPPTEEELSRGSVSFGDYLNDLTNDDTKV